MNELAEPIRSVLRDYCHVEWYELDELVDDVLAQRKKFSVHDLKKQFENIISGSAPCAIQINSLTANEFESEGEAKKWLSEIYNHIFGGYSE